MHETIDSGRRRDGAPDHLLRAQALNAVLAQPAINAANETTLCVHASAQVRAVTGRPLMDITPVVRWAIQQVQNTRLDQYRVKNSHRFGWSYRFPNGHEATVINDPSRPFRFEVCSDHPADATRGRVAPELTTQQVEAKLHAIAALPTR